MQGDHSGGQAGGGGWGLRATKRPGGVPAFTWVTAQGPSRALFTLHQPETPALVTLVQGDGLG